MKHRGFITRRVLVASVLVLPLALLIAVLTTGVMSHQMMGDAGRWVAWAARAIIQGPDPAASTDNALARWDGTGGNLIQNSGVICDDSSNITGVGSLTANNALVANESGGNNDCRIEGDTDANLLYTDASTDMLGVGTSAPAAKLHVVKSSGAPALLGAATTMVLENAGAEDDDCMLVILGDQGGSAGLSFGYPNDPADPAVAGLTTDLTTGELGISADTTSIIGGQKVKRTAVTTTYTVLTTDYYLGITASSALTLNLPTVASAGTGREYLLVIESGGSTVTIDPSGSETINGGAGTVGVSGAFSIRHLVCNGSSWIVEP